MKNDVSVKWDKSLGDIPGFPIFIRISFVHLNGKGDTSAIRYITS